jgi:hypothetical protein
VTPPTGETAAQSLFSTTHSFAIPGDGGSTLIAGLDEAAAALAPAEAAQTKGTANTLAALARPDRLSIFDFFTNPRPESLPWLAGSSPQPLLTVRGAVAEEASWASDGILGLPELPSLPSALGSVAASAAGAGPEIPAAILAVMLLVASRLGRLLRLTPDLGRPPLYVSALERPG